VTAGGGPPIFSYHPSWLPDCSGLRLAVAGADGFIGSYVAASALEAGASVLAICDREPWRLANLDSSRLAVGRGLEPGIDAVAILLYEPPYSYRRDEWLTHELEVNTGRAVEIGRSAKEIGARVVFASSADVYGPWHDDPVTETIQAAPLTPYAEAKLAAEQRLAELAPEVTALRLSTVYGPSEHERRAIPSFARALLAGRPAVVHGDGSDVRDYVHVGDAAAAIVACCVGSAKPTVLNVGTGVGRTTLDVFESVARVIGVEPSARFEETARPRSRLVLDITAARGELGFEPRADFEDALREEIDWLAAT
jgi:UDP-glucose 4-epimerase